MTVAAVGTGSKNKKAKAATSPMTGSPNASTVTCDLACCSRQGGIENGQYVGKWLRGRRSVTPPHG